MSSMLYLNDPPLRKQYGNRERSVLNERDITLLWRKLFRGQEITSLTFEQAEGVLDELRPESPLRLRLTEELEELRKLHQKS